MFSEDKLLLIWACLCCVAASHLKVSVQPSALHYKGSWIGRRANTRTKLCEKVTPHRQYTESAAPSLPLLACLLQQEHQHQTRPKHRAHKISRRSRTICFSSQREGKPQTFSKIKMKNQTSCNSEILCIIGIILVLGLCLWGLFNMDFSICWNYTRTFCCTLESTL